MPQVLKLRNLDSDEPFLVLPGKVSIGRSDEVQIKLDHTSISRHHADIYNTDEGLWLEDHGSTNGTLVRGEYIGSPTQVVIGEVVQIGDLIFRIDPEKLDEPVVGEHSGPEATIQRERFKRRTEKLKTSIITARHRAAVESEPAVEPPPGDAAPPENLNEIEAAPTIQPFSHVAVQAPSTAVKEGIPPAQNTVAINTNTSNTSGITAPHHTEPIDTANMTGAMQVQSIQDPRNRRQANHVPASAATKLDQPLPQQVAQRPTTVTFETSHNYGLLASIFLGGVVVGLIIGFVIASLM